MVSPTADGSLPGSFLAGSGVTGLLLPLKTGLTLMLVLVTAAVVEAGGGSVLVLLFPLNTGLLLPEG